MAKEIIGANLKKIITQTLADYCRSEMLCEINECSFSQLIRSLLLQEFKRQGLSLPPDITQGRAFTMDWWELVSFLAPYAPDFTIWLSLHGNVSAQKTMEIFEKITDDERRKRIVVVISD